MTRATVSRLLREYGAQHEGRRKLLSEKTGVTPDMIYFAMKNSMLEGVTHASIEDVNTLHKFLTDGRGVAPTAPLPTLGGE